MSRTLVNRYMYTCDQTVEHRGHRGLRDHPCTQVQIVDAVCEEDADMLIRQRGWRLEGGWACGGIHKRKDAVA